MAKRLCWRRAEPTIHNYHDVDLTYGGEDIGSVSQTRKDSWYWCFHGHKLGLKTHNSMWREGSYATQEEAKVALLAYAREQLKEATKS